MDTKKNNLSSWQTSVLVVDDNSPDGTYNAVRHAFAVEVDVGLGDDRHIVELAHNGP